MFLRHPTDQEVSSLLLKTETDPVSESCFLVFRIPDNGKSPEPQ
jgi:hypothetical protein